VAGRDDEDGANRPGTVGADVERSFIHSVAECPYHMATAAVYRQAAFGRLSDEAMGSFLARGYRRNSNCIYTMHCLACGLCVPIRLRPERFRPNRNQRRVWRKNRDVTVEVAPLTMSWENVTLLQRFLSRRFPAGESSAESYYSGFFITSIARCFEIRYRVDDALLGVGIVDASDAWMNAVYFFFDPDQGWRSPGTLNILTLVHICQAQRIGLLYLGYWIDGHARMSYKSAFRPHELLIDGVWREQP